MKSDIVTGRKSNSAIVKLPKRSYKKLINQTAIVSGFGAVKYERIGENELKPIMPTLRHYLTVKIQYDYRYCADNEQLLCASWNNEKRTIWDKRANVHTTCYVSYVITYSYESNKDIFQNILNVLCLLRKTITTISTLVKMFCTYK